MTQQNQIVAIEKGVKAQTGRAIADAYHTIQKPALLFGISKTYRAHDDEGDQLPPESTLVQTSLTTVIEGVTAEMTRLFDVTFTKDHTNTLAKADVVIGDEVLVEGAPVPYLLFLEKQLISLHTFISSLPFLDPSEVWTPDDISGNYRTNPVDTIRSKKSYRNHVKAEATQHHPAQVEVFTEDIPVGTWTTVKFSGALPATTLARFLTRVNNLTEAVKMAREQANTTTVQDRECGANIMRYIFEE